MLVFKKSIFIGGTIIRTTGKCRNVFPAVLACKKWHISSLRYSTQSGACTDKFLDDRIALVTGCTSGIGLGIAQHLASRGCSIIMNGFGDETLIGSLKQDFADKYSCKTHYINADLTKTEDIEKMCDNIKSTYPGGVDIIINNAGFQHVSPIEEFATDRWDALISVLLSAPFHFIKHLLPGMKQKGWGRIVNISSAHGLVASPNKAPYVAAKHGLIGLTKVVALETAGSGVTCNALCPGYVNTPILQAQVNTLAEKERCSYKEAEKMFLSNFHATKTAVGIDELAETVIFLCSDAAKQMTGSIISIDGGWVAK